MNSTLLKGGRMTNQTMKSALPNSHSPDLALLAAKLGLAGHQIKKLKDGYLVYRLNLVKYCKYYAELDTFSKKVGVLK